MKQIHLLINTDTIQGHPKGSTVPVQTDKNGTATEKFWRDRLRDAEVDNCVEIVKPKTKTKSSKEDTQ